MESLLQLNLENFSDARQGHYQGKWLKQRQTARRKFPRPRGLSCAARIVSLFSSLPPIPFLLSFPRSSPVFDSYFYSALTLCEQPRERRCRLKVWRSRCPSVSSKLAIPPHNFVLCFISDTLRCNRLCPKVHSRKRSIMRASGIQGTKESDTAIAFFQSSSTRASASSGPIILIATGRKRDSRVRIIQYPGHGLGRLLLIS